MNCLAVWLCRDRSPIDMDSQWSHDIHINQTGRRFEADYHNETGPSASLTPLKVQMLGFPHNLKWFAMLAVDSPFKLPQGPPLGVVALPDGKPEASY